MGVSLCSLLVSSGFVGRAESEVSTGYIFPQGVLAVTTLVAGRARDGGDRARARCELAFLLCSMAIATLSGVGPGIKVLEQKP